MGEKLSVLIGAEVSILKFSDQWVGLVFYGGIERERKYAELQIEADFLLQTSKAKFTIEPGNVATLNDVLPLMRTKIANISLNKDYTLSVVFDSGTKLEAAPIDRYEAWNLTGDDLPYYVASPKGEL